MNGLPAEVRGGCLGSGCGCGLLLAGLLLAARFVGAGSELFAGFLRGHWFVFLGLGAIVGVLLVRFNKAVDAANPDHPAVKQKADDKDKRA